MSAVRVSSSSVQSQCLPCGALHDAQPCVTGSANVSISPEQKQQGTCLPVVILKSRMRTCGWDGLGISGPPRSGCGAARYAVGIRSMLLRWEWRGAAGWSWRHAARADRPYRIRTGRRRRHARRSIGRESSIGPVSNGNRWNRRRSSGCKMARWTLSIDGTGVLVMLDMMTGHS